MSVSQISSVQSATGSTSASIVSASSIQTSSSSGGGGGFPTQQNAVYLWTFLVTLILLMGISAFIVIRSYIYRRRLRRRLEEAIRNGQVLAPHSGIRPKYLGPKPKIWEVWIADSENEWENVVPLSAEVVPLTRYPQRPPPRPPRGSSSSLLQSVIRFPMRPAQSSSPTLSPAPVSVSPPTLDEDHQNIRVTTLIAMPSNSRRGLIHRASSSSTSILKGKQRESVNLDEDLSLCEGIPPVVFGVANFQLNWAKPQQEPLPSAEQMETLERRNTHVIERTTESSIS